jgi:dihydroflavonol-4-reductase
MILVTGGTGLLGSHLLQQLLEAGKPVRALSRRPYSGALLTTEERDRIEWVNGDILDLGALGDAMTDVTQIYHCAALVSFQPKDASSLLKVNIEGTANVVNSALESGVHKMVHVSSVAALGRPRPGNLIDEAVPWIEQQSASRYGKSKHSGEMEVWRGIAEGLDAVIVNPSTILGTGNWEKGSSGLFKSAFDEFPWYSEGINGFVDVRDVTRAMIDLMDSSIQSERFILSGDNWSYHQLFTAMAEDFGKRNPYKKVTPLLAAIVWRMEKLKSLFSGKDPLVTEETARSAVSVSRFDNRKLLAALPGFHFTPLEEAIRYHCGQFLAPLGL